MRDDTAGTYRAPVTYGYTGQDDSSAANPYVAADSHGRRSRPPETAFGREAFVGVGRMEYGIYMYTGADAAVIPYRNPVAVEKYAVHIYLHIAAQMYILAIVYKEWRGDRHILATRPEKPVQQRRLSLGVVRSRRIILRLQPFCLVPTAQERIIKKGKKVFHCARMGQ